VAHTAFTLPSEADRVLILMNPRAGRRSAAGRTDRLAELLRHRGLGVKVFADVGEVTARANRLHDEGRLRALVGVGGDGTAAELANRTQPGVPITLLAAGTANLLARQFGLSTKPEQMAETIAGGNCQRIDAGQADGRVFLLMASCGFDADVVRQVHALRQSTRAGGHIGYAHYLKPILRSIRNYEYPPIRIYWDEPCRGAAQEKSEEPLVARWVFAFNLPRYGWGLKLTPEAVATDGLLDVCTFRRGTLWHGLRYLAGVQLGSRHRRLADCVIRRAKRIRIASDRPVAYQLDGDPGGQLPLDVESLPGRLTLLVPPNLTEPR